MSTTTERIAIRDRQRKAVTYGVDAMKALITEDPETLDRAFETVMERAYEARKAGQEYQEYRNP
jgi:hypothetical protein